MAGKQVLEIGLGYLVGNGEEIKVWIDPWLSTSSPLTPICPSTLYSLHLRVSDLLDHHSNEWNIQAIQQHLPQYEAAIRQLIPSSLKPADSKVWLLEELGIYSAKTGYHSFIQDKNQREQQTFNWMFQVWKAKTSPKLNQFLWRALNKALLVGELLAYRGMSWDLNCKCCSEAESICHILWRCPFAKQIWELAPVSHGPLLSFLPLSPKQLLTSLSRAINLLPSGLIMAPLAP
ncbi:unnamed protein product [Thlaspi arvense]|uniref:Reverse transcriptase zinc-binding domain-containing protein n=1 Tax=Thlaspi arvense TaxID=13288 RepID=A0AAU9SEP5_THLAR|nr:unnamed protein product [Thlaspi arvense]